MADAGEWITDAEILKLCGDGVHADVAAADWFDTIIVNAEAIVNSATRYDWTTLGAAAINDTVEGILAEASGCLAAIHGVKYNMSGYTSRIEAEDLINVLRDIALRNLSILRDKKTQEFMINA